MSGWLHLHNHNTCVLINRVSFCVYKWVQSIIFLSCKRHLSKMVWNRQKMLLSLRSLLLKYWYSSHTHTHCQLLETICYSLLSVVQKRSQQSICLSFQKEPELNHTSSTSRPSSSTSQAKNGEEKASLPTSLPKTVYDHSFTISGPNENARLIAFSFKLWHWFDSTGRPVDYSRTEPSSGGDHIIVTADNPAVTAPTMTHASKWTFD